MSNTEKKEKSKFRLSCENYWYHYKWQTVFGVFFLIVGIICIVQTFNVQSYDAYVMYAGNYQMSRVEFLDMQDEFEKVIEDGDGDGKIVVDMRDIMVLSEEEIKKRKEEGYEVMESLIADNLNLFDQEIFSGEATICLLSPMLFDRANEGGAFLPIAEFVGETDAEYYGECGIYLHSIPFGSLPGLRDLPEDTILCVRRVSTMASLFGKKEAERDHARNLVAVRAIFAYRNEETTDGE